VRILAKFVFGHQLRNGQIPKSTCPSHQGGCPTGFSRARPKSTCPSHQGGVFQSATKKIDKNDVVKTFSSSKNEQRSGIACRNECEINLLFRKIAKARM
jgi:hypothetical protein